MKLLRLSVLVVLPLLLVSCGHESEPVAESQHEDAQTVSDHSHHSGATDESATQHLHDEHTHDSHSASNHGQHDGHAVASHEGHNSEQSNHPAPSPHSNHGHSAKVAPHSTKGEVAHAGKLTKQTAAESADASAIFAQRILPILKADSSSSCTQCHFAGVELRDFILEDQAETFASLKSAGMINVDQPDESKILKFIGRKPEKSDPLMEKVRQTELIAFQAWIHAAVREPELLNATSDVDVGTTLPPKVIRHARSDRVLSSFIDNIWSEMGRCINCHNPERNRQKIGRDGFTREDVDAISWIVPRDPAATLRQLVDSGNVDLDDPAASPVLTKPAGLEDHGGGPKFFPGSQTYRNFLAFLTDYADITKGKYKSPRDLPAASEEITLLSEQQLRITNIPAAFSDMPLQVDLYRRDPQSGQWSEHRWATGFSRVNGKQHVWQNPIMVAAPTDSPLAKEFRERPILPPGEYRIQILIDRLGKTKNNPTYELGDTEFVAEAQISGNWKPGYQPPKIVAFPEASE
ncbi:hypothetical protein GC176_17385 [bacterium]|nr:hypothetical protein [bacterium]